MIVFRIIQKIEAFVLSYGILAMATLTILNVLSRVITGESLASMEELTQFLIIMITFLGTSYAAGRARHIRMSAIYDQFDVKGRKVLLVLSGSLTSLMLLYLGYFSITYAWRVKFLEEVSPVLGVPIYLIYLSAPIGLILAGIQYAMMVYKNLTHEDVFLSYEVEDHNVKRKPLPAE